MSITTHPNQRIVVIERELPKKTKEEQRPYMVAYIDNIAAAGKNLNGVAFKLYCYLLSNESYFNLVFSPKDFTNNYGGSIKSAQGAFTELEEKGYIVLEKGNRFHFYETPQKSIKKAAVKKASPEPIEAADLEINSGEVVGMAEMFKDCKQLDSIPSAKKDWIKELM